MIIEDTIVVQIWHLKDSCQSSNTGRPHLWTKKTKKT